MNWYVYMICCQDKSIYTGITNNIQRRFLEHQAQGKKCAKYLRGKGPLELVYEQKIGSRGEALKVEVFIKNLTKKEKMEIIFKQKINVRNAPPQTPKDAC